MFAKHTQLIDINAWGYECQQGTVLRAGPLQTQACFGVLRRMREVRSRWPHATPLVLWDGRAQWRYDLYPNYKSNRTATPERIAMKEAYAQMKPYIERALAALGIRQITAFTHEADDMAGHFVRKLSADPTHHIELFTGDQDWLQFVRPNVSWRDLRDDTRRVNHANFYDFTGCRTPLEFLERKCLMGDTSDCITGVGGLGEKGAAEFIATWGSVRKFWRACEDGSYTPKTKAERSLYAGRCEFDREDWAAQLVLPAVASDPKEQAKVLKKHMDAWPGQGRLLFARNFQLMQLLKVTPPQPQDIKVIDARFNKDAFADLCAELAFLSILKSLDEFIAPFEPRR